MLISYLCTYKTHNYVNENKGFPKLKKKFAESTLSQQTEACDPVAHGSSQAEENL